MITKDKDASEVLVFNASMVVIIFSVVAAGFDYMNIRTGLSVIASVAAVAVYTSVMVSSEVLKKED